MAVDDLSWPDYNAAQRGRGPRPLCTKLLAQAGHGRGRLAVDLGAGAGIETKALLDAGWRVVAIDSDHETPRRLTELTGDRTDLQVRVAGFEEAVLPAADLIHAGYSLPFVARPHFAAVWQGIRSALRPDGWVAVDLFGERDSWAGRDDMTFVSRDDLDDLLLGLRVVDLEEEDVDGASFIGPKHWHIYHVIARRGESVSAPDRLPR